MNITYMKYLDTLLSPGSHYWLQTFQQYVNKDELLLVLFRCVIPDHMV